MSKHWTRNWQFRYDDLTIGDVNLLAAMGKGPVTQKMLNEFYGLMKRLLVDVDLYQLSLNEVREAGEAFGAGLIAKWETSQDIDDLINRLESWDWDGVSPLDGEALEPPVHDFHIQAHRDKLGKMRVTAICPNCDKRKRAIEQMLSWVLYCSCGWTGEVTTNPPEPCQCSQCGADHD